MLFKFHYSVARQIDHAQSRRFSAFAGGGPPFKERAIDFSKSLNAQIADPAGYCPSFGIVIVIVRPMCILNLARVLPERGLKRRRFYHAAIGSEALARTLSRAIQYVWLNIWIKIGIFPDVLGFYGHSDNGHERLGSVSKMPAS